MGLRLLLRCLLATRTRLLPAGENPGPARLADPPGDTRSRREEVGLSGRKHRAPSTGFGTRQVRMQFRALSPAPSQVTSGRWFSSSHCCRIEKLAGVALHGRPL